VPKVVVIDHGFGSKRTDYPSRIHLSPGAGRQSRYPIELAIKSLSPYNSLEKGNTTFPVRRKCFLNFFLIEDKMATLEKLQEIAASFDPAANVATAKWFGKPCINVGKKVFVVLWGQDLAFKLTGAAHAEALQVPDAHLFDPRGQGSPMKEWVQIPEAQSAAWERFARLAYEFVSASQA
jgi:hypothetical protein